VVRRRCSSPHASMSTRDTLPSLGGQSCADAYARNFDWGLPRIATSSADGWPIAADSMHSLTPIDARGGYGPQDWEPLSEHDRLTSPAAARSFEYFDPPPLEQQSPEGAGGRPLAFDDEATAELIEALALPPDGPEPPPLPLAPELRAALDAARVFVLVPEAPMDSPEVPEAAVALFFATRVPLSAGGRALVQRISVADQRPLIVMVSLTTQPGGDLPRGGLVRAMRMLRQLGADDVDRLPSTMDDCVACVEVSLARANALREARLDERASRRRAVALLRVQREAQLREARLFWQVAHRAHPDFRDLPVLSQAQEPTIGGSAGTGEGHTVEEELSQGDAGYVYLVRDVLTGQLRALKAVSKQVIESWDDLRAVCKEIATLRKLQHPNIASLHDTVQSMENIMLLLEYAGHRSLHSVLREAPCGGLAPERARRYLRQAAHALVHCHSRGVAHRDVKPEHFGVSDDDEKLMLLDFGEAQELDAPFLWGGTMPFLAPEILAQLTQLYRPAAVDMWSLGVVLLEMLCGLDVLPRMLAWAAPWDPEPRLADDLAAFLAPAGLLEARLRENLPGPLPEPEALHELLRGMLTVNVATRWNSTHALGAAWLSVGEGST